MRLSGNNSLRLFSGGCGDVSPGALQVEGPRTCLPSVIANPSIRCDGRCRCGALQVPPREGSSLTMRGRFPASQPWVRGKRSPYKHADQIVRPSIRRHLTMNALPKKSRAARPRALAFEAVPGASHGLSLSKEFCASDCPKAKVASERWTPVFCRKHASTARWAICSCPSAMQLRQRRGWLEFAGLPLQSDLC